MDKKKSSNSSVFFRKKPILVNVANLTLKGHLGLEAASVHGVLIISNDSNNNHKKVVDGISVRLLGSLNCSVSLHDRSFEEIVHTILDITQPIFERGTKRVPTSVTLDSLPNQLNSSAVNLNSGHTTVFIQSEEGIDIPSKKQIFIPITIDIPQIKGEKLPPSIALWRKTHCCETKYRLQVLIKQEGMKEPIELEVALPVQVETFNPGDVAVYVRGKDAVLFTLKFPRILIPSEHWDFSYTFKYTDQNPNSNWRVKGISIELSEMVTLDPAFSQYKQGDVLNLTRTVFTWKSTEGAQNWENLNVVTFEAPRWPTTVEDFPGVNPSGHWDVLTISHVFTIDLSFLGVNPIRYEFPVNVLAASLNSLKDLTKNHSKLLLDIWEFKDGSDEVIASVKLRSPIPRESNNSPEFDYLNEAIRNSLDISRTSSGRTGLVNGLTTFDFNSRRNSLTISRNLGNLLDFEEDKIGAEGNTVPPSYTDVVSSKHRVAVAYYPIQVDEILLEYNDLVEVLERFNDGWLRGRNLRTNASGFFPGNSLSQFELELNTMEVSLTAIEEKELLALKNQNSGDQQIPSPFNLHENHVIHHVPSWSEKNSILNSLPTGISENSTPSPLIHESPKSETTSPHYGFKDPVSLTFSYHESTFLNRPSRLEHQPQPKARDVRASLESTNSLQTGGRVSPKSPFIQAQSSTQSSNPIYLPRKSSKSKQNQEIHSVNSSPSTKSMSSPKSGFIQKTSTQTSIRNDNLLPSIYSHKSVDSATNIPGTSFLRNTNTVTHTDSEALHEGEELIDLLLLDGRISPQDFVDRRMTLRSLFPNVNDNTTKIRNMETALEQKLYVGSMMVEEFFFEREKLRQLFRY